MYPDPVFIEEFNDFLLFLNIGCNLSFLTSGQIENSVLWVYRLVEIYVSDLISIFHDLQNSKNGILSPWSLV